MLEVSGCLNFDEHCAEATQRFDCDACCYSQEEGRRVKEEEAKEARAKQEQEAREKENKDKGKKGPDKK